MLRHRFVLRAHKTRTNVCMSNPQSLRLHSPPHDLNQYLVLDPPQCVDDPSVLSVCAQCLRPLMDDSSDLFHHNSQCIFIYLFSIFIVLTESFDRFYVPIFARAINILFRKAVRVLFLFLELSMKFTSQHIGQLFFQKKNVSKASNQYFCYSKTHANFYMYASTF